MQGLSLALVIRTDDSLEFSVDGQSAFELPYSTLSQSVIQGKHEV